MAPHQERLDCFAALAMTVSGFRAAMLPLAIDRGVSYMIVQEAEISQPLFAGVRTARITQCS
jgi:hypothetical protein